MGKSLVSFFDSWCSINNRNAVQTVDKCSEMIPLSGGFGEVIELGEIQLQLTHVDSTL